jgi:cobalt-precorrin-7 (C5)-methyltransferase
MINIIGLGPGNIGYCTKLGEKLIYNSDIIIGGKRNLDSINDFKGEKIELSTNLKEIVEYLKINKDKNISVIASGDPSIYGIGKYLSNNIDKSNLNIVSGISSIQYIFSRICVDMNDLYITSSHGKIPDFDYILKHTKVCMVTDNKIGPREIANEILKRSLNKVMVVGENLSYDNEKITISKPKEILEIEKFDMNVVVILDEK